MNAWFDDNIPREIADALALVRVKLASGTEVARDFRPDVDINYDDLEEQLAKAPSAYAYWAMVFSEQKTIVGVVERRVKKRRACVAETVLSTAKSEGMTLRATDMKELIEGDDELNRLEAELLIARRAEGKLYHIVEAIRMKSEHLRSLAGFKKQELRDAGMG